MHVYMRTAPVQGILCSMLFPFCKRGHQSTLEPTAYPNLPEYPGMHIYQGSEQGFKWFSECR